jgi:benzoyl-CoA reductase/2-hydroxyglutaryl-CoA dehydratase subunit BcrC/BadD/HgdB
LEERDNLEDVIVDRYCQINLKDNGYERIKWILTDSGDEQVAGCCEHGSEHAGSIKRGEFLD